MRYTLHIAWRYIYAFRNFNAVHVIAGVSVLGISLGTAALVLVMAVFNGLEVLLTDLMNTFNPDLKVVPVEGKYMEPSDDDILAIEAIHGVEAVSITLEEIAFFEYGNKQDIGIIKGVDHRFLTVTELEKAIVRGSALFLDGNRYLGVLGLGMEYKLGVRIDDPFESIVVMMPRQTATAGLQASGFVRRFIQPAGVFSLQQNADAEYILSDLEFVRELLERPGAASFIEISLMPGSDVSRISGQVKAILGERVDVLDRYRQDASFYRLLQLEKWVGFIILSLMIFLVAFNMMGALWMLVLDKRPDIIMLKAMGATAGHIRSVFIFTGLLLATCGLTVGFLLALVFYLVQNQWDLIRLGEAEQFLVDAYPMQLLWSDFAMVGLLVLAAGYIMSLLPARRAASVIPVIRSV